MNQDTYRDMHLLNEVTHTPDITQRDLSKRIGAALGLTNLMLRRLTTKGYIKIVNIRKSRLRYLITPQGVMEKARLAREYVEYSLFFYRHVRGFLQERLREVANAGHRRVLVWGTGELAEIAYLAIQEAGLTFAGVVDMAPEHKQFLGHEVRAVEDIALMTYDRVIIASLEEGDVTDAVAQFVSCDAIITVPRPGAPRLAGERGDAGATLTASFAEETTVRSSLSS